MAQLPSSVERRMKRFYEQRWLLDTVIGTVGVEWDQNRIAYISAPAGPEAIGDFIGVKARVRKFSDIPREFARAARRREAAARSYEEEGHIVSARDCYFIASLLYGGAMWAIFANTPENIEYNERKIECYKKFIQFAPHKITRVEIPFAGKSLPGYLHLPPGASGRLPCVLAIDGMDGFKEMMVAEYGDKLLQRGAAVLAIDGPGQGECCVREIHCAAANFIDAGRAALAWLREHPAIDGDRIAISAVSMGSFWSTQIASADDRIRACAVAFTCHEPGLYTLLNAASPTFKLRFMYMAGYDDEEQFDQFATKMDLSNLATNIKCPYLAIAGEDDELSPIENTHRLMEKMTCPKELMVYQGERHSLHSAASTALGPSPHSYIADWLTDRLAGKTMESRRMFVDLAGNVQVSPW